MTLSRRAVLRGFGCALALPYLEAMTSVRSARAGSAAVPAAMPKRTVFVFFPNGVNRREWMPQSPGPLDTLPSSLEPLRDMRSRVTVIGGLAHANADALGDGPGDHARSAACFLTGAHPRKTAGADITAGVSIDQVLAKAVGGATRFDSLEVGLEPGMTAGNCDSGYSCAYSANISWRSPHAPMPKEHDPRAFFERLFAVGPEGEVAEARARRLDARKSILDGARDETLRLRRELGGSDRRKLDEYLDGVRSLERRIETAERLDRDGAMAGIPPRPTGVPTTWHEHAEVMNELIVLALRLDLSRIVTYMFANEGSNRPYPAIDVRAGHHDVSHHDGSEEKLKKFAAINHHHTEQFAHLLRALEKTRDESDRSLLDATTVVYGGAIGDGNAHDHRDLPVIVAGGEQGEALASHHGSAWRPSRERPMCDLYLALARRHGLNIERFGDSVSDLAE